MGAKSNSVLHTNGQLKNIHNCGEAPDIATNVNANESKGQRCVYLGGFQDKIHTEGLSSTISQAKEDIHKAILLHPGVLYSIHEPVP
jgi:hypothetical protein